jgi:hypothetical protein
MSKKEGPFSGRWRPRRSTSKRRATSLDRAKARYRSDFWKVRPTPFTPSRLLGTRPDLAIVDDPWFDPTPTSDPRRTVSLGKGVLMLGDQVLGEISNLTIDFRSETKP